MSSHTEPKAKPGAPYQGVVKVEKSKKRKEKEEDEEDDSEKERDTDEGDDDEQLDSSIFFLVSIIFNFLIYHSFPQKKKLKCNSG